VSDLAATAAFNGKTHLGTDYRAATGTNVLAMAPGKVIKVGLDSRPSRKADPRSGKTVKGWGRYVILQHPDGTKTVYAHLLDGGVTVGESQDVVAGDVIALSDNSGGSAVPHVHLEYIHPRSTRADPHACVVSEMVFSGAMALQGPAEMTNATCTGTMSVPGTATVTLGLAPRIRLQGSENMNLTCFSQSTPIDMTFDLVRQGGSLNGSIRIPFTCAPPCVTGETAYFASLKILLDASGQSVTGVVSHTNTNQTPFNASASGTVTLTRPQK